MKNYPSIRALASYVWRFRAAYLTTVAIFVLSDVVISLFPWLIGRLTVSLSQHDGRTAFWTSALIAASITHAITWHGAELIYLKKLMAPIHRFDDEVFSRVLQHEFSYFVDKFTGKISSYANTLGRDARELFDNSLYRYVNLFVSLPIIIATMFTVNVYTGGLFVLSLVLMYVAGRKLARVAAEAERKESDERSTMDGYVVDAVANFVSIKAFTNERRESDRLFSKRLRMIHAASTSFGKDILFWSTMSLFVRAVIWPAAFILNVYLYAHGQLSLAGMTTFLTAIVLFVNYIWEVIWNVAQLNIKVAGIEEAYRYLFGERNIFAEAPSDAAASANAAASEGDSGGQPGFSSSLELRGLTFAYPDKPDAAVLRDVNLAIRKGERIGIVGPSGGGKSTLLKLLLDYYPVEPSQLLIDGQPAGNRRLARLAAYVPQDTAVFHRSIAENIAYGRPDASQDEVVTAAKHAQAHDFIMGLDNGYDTLVGERGIKLSGGQRQRIAIARAILKDAPLLLLDEATSALDSESEKLIQKALYDLLEDRTALVIAHRLSTIQHMDRIVVFDRGRIVEEGSHQQLLKKKGLYAKLWSHQTDGFIEE